MFRSSFLSLLTLLMLSVPAHSQTPDSTFFNGLRYRLVGPARGGRVTTVTGVPSQPKTFYMGVASGGLFRTTDNGATWTPITDGKSRSAQPDLLPLPIPIQTSSISAPDLTACAVTSPLVAAFISRSTAEKRGRSQASIMRDRSERCASTQRTRASFGWRWPATSSSQTKSVAFLKQLTAAR